MKEETRIIIKNKLFKSAKQSFEDEKIQRMTYILGARKLLLLLAEHQVLEFNSIEHLFDDLDLNKMKL